MGFCTRRKRVTCGITSTATTTTAHDTISLHAFNSTPDEYAGTGRTVDNGIKQTHRKMKKIVPFRTIDDHTRALHACAAICLRRFFSSSPRHRNVVDKMIFYLRNRSSNETILHSARYYSPRVFFPVLYNVVSIFHYSIIIPTVALLSFLIICIPHPADL